MSCAGPGAPRRTEDPMPHTMSDVLVVLKDEREPHASTSSRTRCASG